MTEENVKPALLRSYRTLLLPLLRVLLRNGVVLSELVETIKYSMVEAAVRSEPEKALDVEQVSRRTGIALDEVERIIAESLADSHDTLEADSDRAIKVLEGWHRDEGYVGVYGLANELTTDEFEVLCKRYAPDRSPGYLAQLLVDSQCAKVISDPDGGDTRVRCVSRTFVPKPLTIPQIERMGRLIANFVSTIDNNVHGLGQPRLEKRVWPASGLQKKHLEVFDSAIRDKSDEYLYAIDNWLSSYHEEYTADADEADVVHTGVGVFHYIESNDSRKSFRDVLLEKGLSKDGLRRARRSSGSTETNVTK